jgi:putative DNA primase/helicase
MRASVLDKIVAKERQRAEADKGIGFDEVDPWPEAVAGDGLLSDLAATIARFIVCKPETIHAATLWLVMTWLIDEVDTAPLAVITAPEKRCGKSQLLTIMGRLSRRPVVASNISPVALFRVIDAWQPTLMIDEADAFMRENEELRGIINSGHKRDSAYVVRAVGEDFVPKQFSTWGAKAIAGIGHLADTLMDRAIVLDLRRKLPHENVERLRYAEPGLFDDLASRLCRFAEDNRDAVRRARPDLPQTLNDRQQDNWEPLLAIADVVGGVWPEQARHAALVISGSGDDTLTLGAELLFDIQEVFETKHIDRIGTADLIAALIEDDEKPWATYNRGKPVSPRQIAKRLKEYGISSKTIRIGYETQKGFEKNQFSDAFIRYLTYPENVRNNVTNPQESINHAACSVTDMKNTYVTKSANPSQRNKSATEGYQSEAIGTGGHQSGAAGTEGHQSAKIPQPCGLQRSGQSEKNVTDTSVTLQALPAQGLSGVKEKCDGRTRAYVTLEPSNGKGCDVVTDKNGGENDRNVFEGLHVTHLPDGRIEVEI